MDKMLFTSESVTCGHPDKVCDQVADKILDELLAQDPYSRVACEVTCAENQMHIFGEITSEAKVDYRAAAQQVIAGIGYTRPGRGFDADTCAITAVMPVTAALFPERMPPRWIAVVRIWRATLPRIS